MLADAASVRDRITSHGLVLASSKGLHAVSIGAVARDLPLTKSQIFAVYPSDESLQLGVLEQAAQQFIREVMEPGLAAPLGERRVRALFGRWLAWSRSPRLVGGCPFVHASAESEALPDKVRARLTEVLNGWSAVLRAAIEEGKALELEADLDADQLAFEMYGLYLSHHFWHWSMRDAQAEWRTVRAIDRLIAAARR